MTFDNTYDFDPLKLALTPAEAAVALGVSKSHVYRMIHRGELHAAQLGRRWVVSSVGLMRLLDPHRPSPGGGGERAGLAPGLAVEPGSPPSSG
jgi:excisionase family DNA binding protein